MLRNNLTRPSEMGRICLGTSEHVIAALSVKLGMVLEKQRVN